LIFTFPKCTGQASKGKHMVQKSSDNLHLLAGFIKFNLQLYENMPKEKIAARQLISQIAAELQKLSDNEKHAFCRLFPAIDRKLRTVPDFQRITDCYTKKGSEFTAERPQLLCRNIQAVSSQQLEVGDGAQCVVSSPHARSSSSETEKLPPFNQLHVQAVSSPWKKIHNSAPVRVIRQGTARKLCRKKIDTSGNPPSKATRKIKNTSENEYRGFIRSALCGTRVSSQETQSSTRGA